MNVARVPDVAGLWCAPAAPSAPSPVSFSLVLSLGRSACARRLLLCFAVAVAAGIGLALACVVHEPLGRAIDRGAFCASFGGFALGSALVAAKARRAVHAHSNAVRARSSSYRGPRQPPQSPSTELAAAPAATCEVAPPKQLAEMM